MGEKKVKSPEIIKKEALQHFGAVVRALYSLGKKKTLTLQIRAIMEALK
jgi:hypothetical protein